ncbi:unnamed protein product, partial [Lampetra planeri]
WLVDRRHCNLKWQSVVKVIREKINAAMQDMPENEEIKQLLSGSYIHYFHCLRIVEILKGTEASSKNIFGRYSSQRMKDWQEIVSLYETDNVYLAEVASLLSRNVSYEGPALRKQVAKAQQLQQELSRKEVECQSCAADLRERYYTACKQYGIKIDWGDFGTGTDTQGVNTGITLEEGIDWGVSPELEVFLTQRLSEMGEEADVVAISQFQLAPSIIQNQTREHIQKRLSEVQDLLGRLTTLRMQHLFMIQASPRYVERVTEILRQKMKQADILVLKAATMAEKRQEALEEQSRLEPRIDLLAGRTKELQKQ